MPRVLVIVIIVTLIVAAMQIAIQDAYAGVRVVPRASVQQTLIAEPANNALSKDSPVSQSIVNPAATARVHARSAQTAYVCLIPVQG